MIQSAKSIRPFIGAKDFEISRNFYKDLGFQESIISSTLSYFNLFDHLGFYLQKAYVKDWVDNSMLFVEVDNVDAYYAELQNLGLSKKYEHVRLVPIRHEDWGSECFLHDPSGILWHFGTFKK